jgi:carboxyvinyl-carboxyphosphonate phosphorylmutase
MKWTARRRAMRAILEGDRCIFPASVFDPLSARIAENIGFEAGMYAGSIASLTVLGAPDLILLTLSEFADQALRINRACNLPVLADADHGYGNALNVRRTVEELEVAGIAALTIEDTLLPRAYNDDRVMPISIEEGVGKMKAAVSARTDPDLVILARTGAITMTGLDDTLARIRAYEKTGVDGIFLAGIRTRAEIEAVHATTKLPVLFGALVPEISDKDFLARHGVRFALQGHLPFMAAVEAVHATMSALRNGTKPADVQGVASNARMKSLSGDASYRDAIEAFMTSSGTDRQA